MHNLDQLMALFI